MDLDANGNGQSQNTPEPGKALHPLSLISLILLIILVGVVAYGFTVISASLPKTESTTLVDTLGSGTETPAAEETSAEDQPSSMPEAGDLPSGNGTDAEDTQPAETTDDAGGQEQEPTN